MYIALHQCFPKKDDFRQIELVKVLGVGRVAVKLRGGAVRSGQAWPGEVVLFLF